jgi:hypothetical protein
MLFAAAGIVCAVLLLGSGFIWWLSDPNPKREPLLDTKGRRDPYSTKSRVTSRALLGRPPESRAKPLQKFAQSDRARADTQTLQSVSPIHTTVSVHSDLDEPAVTQAPAGVVRSNAIEDLPRGGRPSGMLQFPAQNPAPTKSSKKSKEQLLGAEDSTLAAHQMVDAPATVDRTAVLWVHSPDPRISWRISSGRDVEMSSDAGTTWRTQWTSASAHVVAGSAPSADTCWLVGSTGIVLRTTDAKKWHAISPPEVDDFTSVSASDGRSATITTKDGRQFKTRDGGKRWTPAP